ncbi:NAD(P)/FAD-dependent oxidoreductase [Cyanobacterium aponinum FACHB-4101]|uniref:demethylphylloquinone reductase n=1 Tax=Cyanobacterium aponinum (strain PCC 10605) TaxID=755178 RepID=K9Z932_CYAAP|nr:NADH dehydrogenase [Cyanobacterium aponinum PCC 10605]MBD2394914.1 NAD(P)/FAD-dependent oxidoreductase [Cyanobacterium aponinum FACHB-4101]
MVKVNKIVILGGGFGGLYTAIKLAQFPWQESNPEIVLIDKNDRFLFSPLLYELITDEMQSWEVAPSYYELLSNTSIRFLQDTVTEIDDTARQISLKNNGDLSYDYLVMALGGKTPVNQVSGASDFAIPFRTLEDAYRVKEKLRVLENSDLEAIRVVVVGGGYSGVELALKVADRLGKRGKIRIVDRGSEILSDSPEFNRKTAEKALRDRTIWTDLETEVTNITEKDISLSYKNQIDTIPVDLVLWTVGTKPVMLEKKFPFATNAQGKIEINSYLQVKDNSVVWALGDLVECYDQQGKKLPATAQVAFQQADYCAWNIWATIENKPLLAFKYQPLGEMLALGKDSATISGLGLSLGGGLGYLARRLIYLYRLPTFEHQMAVAMNWITSPLTQLIGSANE